MTYFNENIDACVENLNIESKYLKNAISVLFSKYRNEVLIIEPKKFHLRCDCDLNVH